MTATTAIPEAVRTGLARSFGSSDSRSVSGNAAIISTSLGALERPYFRQAADLRPLRSTSLPLRESVSKNEVNNNGHLVVTVVLRVHLFPFSPKPFSHKPPPKFRRSALSILLRRRRPLSASQATSNLLPVTQTSHHSRSLVSAAFPSFPSSNDPLFDPYCNVGIIVGEGEPGERVLGRLRREVSRAGIIRECRRRRFFETTQEKKKRKSRDAARRNRMRRPPPRVQQQGIAESRKDEEGYKSDEDNWDISDVEAPYT
nr:30S ribosomal protein S21, chloroplastic-like [Ipomoea batatas]GMD38528.1 30S ribosomal protein S21, chloroplastic-like [Ipomoea batatas]